MTKKSGGNEAGLIREALQNKLSKEEVQASKQKPESIIHIKDIEVIETSEDIKMAIEQTPGLEGTTSRVYVASVRKGFAGIQNATVHMQKDDSERLLKLKTIRIGLPSCRIVPDRQIVACFQCWNVGHTVTKCGQK